MGNCLNLAILAAAISPESNKKSISSSLYQRLHTSIKNISLSSTHGEEVHHLDHDSNDGTAIFGNSGGNGNQSQNITTATTTKSSSCLLSSLYTLGPELGRGQTSVTRLCTSVSSPRSSFACKSIPKPSLCHQNQASLRDDMNKDIMREVRIMRRLSGSFDSSCSNSPSESVSGRGTAPSTAPSGKLRIASSLGSSCAGTKPSTQITTSEHSGSAPDTTTLSSCPMARLHHVVEDAQFTHLIMDLCRGGELFDRISHKKRYQEPQAAHIIKSLLEAVRFFHSVGIVHRDLKPENILFVDESETSPIKVVDFGLALEFSPGQKFSDVAGSTYYIAPEVLKGEYSEEIDMWSVGVILYILLSGVPPFWGTTNHTILKAIREGHLELSCEPWDKISSSAKDLIRGMLRCDVKSRLTPEQALRSPWILRHTESDQRVEQSAIGDNTSIASDLLHQECGDALSIEGRNETCSAESVSPSPKPDLHEILSCLVNDRMKAKSIETSFEAKWVKAGWTCTLLTVTPHENMLLVELGQKKYIVVHDKKRKRIGWKMLAAPRCRQDATSGRKLRMRGNVLI